jgi:hypothetical protein
VSEDAEAVAELVREQLAQIEDAALLDRIRELLVLPYPVDLDWDYGQVGQVYRCWTVLEHRPSNTGIVFASRGFGPKDPWGIVFLSGPNLSMGMDCCWYSRLEDAVRESRAWDAAPPPGYEVP